MTMPPTTPRLHSFSTLAGALILAACAANPANSHPEDLIGCWYVQQDGNAAELGLPWGVRLLADPLEGWPAMQQLEDVRTATTLAPEGDRDHPFGFWRPLAADSITIGYPAGGGLSLRLEVDSATLTGTAHPVGDILPLSGAERPVTPVTLTRASCPDAD